MKLIKQADLKRRMVVLVTALAAVAAGLVLGLVIPMVLQSDSDTSSGKLDYDLSPYNASAWFVGPPANMDEFVGKMDAIVVAEVTSVIGSDGGYVNRCVNDIRRRPSQPLIQWRFHPHTVHRDRRLRSTQGPSDA